MCKQRVSRGFWFCVYDDVDVSGRPSRIAPTLGSPVSPVGPSAKPRLCPRHLAFHANRIPAVIAIEHGTSSRARDEKALFQTFVFLQSDSFDQAQSNTRFS